MVWDASVRYWRVPRFCMNAVDLRLVVCGADGLAWLLSVGCCGWLGMQQRVTKLEVNADRMRADIDELKADVRELKADVRVLKVDVAVLKTDVAHLKKDMSEVKIDLSSLKGVVERDFRILFGAIIFVALGLSGLLAKGFHWI